MVRKVKYCKCGCGKEIVFKPYHKYYGIPDYIRGHNHNRYGKTCWCKDKKFEEERERRRKPFVEKYCECGCETLLLYANRGQRFVSGHNNKGKPAWNSGHTKEDDPRVALSEETRKKIRKAKKGGKVWNEGLTKETDPRVKQQSEKISKSMSGKKNPMYGKHHKLKTVEKIRKKAIARIKNNKNRFSNTYIELKMKEQLKRNGINYIPQHYIEGVGFVDFFLPNSNLIIECDGDYWHNLDRVKKKDSGRDFNAEFLHQYPTIRFWEHEINESPEKCIKRIINLTKRK